jgi:hypothetical protein
MGSRASLDDVEKRKFLTLPGLELRPLGRLARSQSLYRLRYPGSLSTRVIKEIDIQFSKLCFYVYSIYAVAKGCTCNLRYISGFGT